MDTSTSVPMSVGAAAAHAKVSTKTVRRWLTSGRLQASRGADGAWLIELDDLEHAIATPGLATDSPTLAIGRAQDMSIVQELLNRLEAQAGEIATLRLERDQARDQLLALQAPPQERPEPELAAKANGRHWWRVWAR